MSRVLCKKNPVFRDSFFCNLIQLKASAFCFITMTGTCTCNCNFICTAFLLIVKCTLAGFAVYVNCFASTFSANTVHRTSASFHKTAAAGFVCNFCIASIYYDISFRAVFLFVVDTGSCCTI